MIKLTNCMTKNILSKYRLFALWVCFICLLQFSCSSKSVSLKGVQSSDVALAEELIETIKELDKTAQAGDVAGVEQLFDPARIELHKKRVAKAGYSWDSKMVKGFNWMKNVNKSKILSVTTKGIWSRLEMLQEPSEDSKERVLHTIIFYKLGDKWKIYNNTQMGCNDGLTESPELFIKKGAHLESFIPPITEVGISEYSNTSITQLLEVVKNKDKSLNGTFVETQGVLFISKVGTEYFLNLRPSSSDNMFSGISLITREEYIKDLEKIVTQCNSQCNVLVRGVVSEPNIFPTQIEIK